jgi:hypothetical protein
MKFKNYFIYLSLFCFLLILINSGCSSQYIEKDFNSRAAYYSKINKTLESRNAEIYFMNGSEINGSGINIKDDSLFWQSPFMKNHHASTPLKSIKNIYYNSYNSLNPVNFDGSIKLYNDSAINVSNAVFLKDTLSYNDVSIYEKKLSKPIDEINSLSFSDHYKGISQYGFTGIFVGGLLGLKGGSGGSIRDQNPLLGLIAGSVVLGLSGLIFGAAIGNQENYVLNNNDSGTLKFLKKFGIIGGITSSLLYGSFSDNREYTTTSNVDFTIGFYYLWDISNVFKIRPEIIYNNKGGLYHYIDRDVNPYNYESQGTSSINLQVVEIPVLAQFESPFNELKYLKAFAGPSFNIPFKGKLEEYYDGPMDQGFEYYDISIKGKEYFSLIFGIGIKWDRHFSTEFLYDKEFTGAGSVQMLDGTIINMKSEALHVTVAFSL